MKKDDLLLVTNLSSLVIKNGARFRRVLGVLPPSVFLSTYSLALIAAFLWLDIDAIGPRVYVYLLMLAAASTQMACYLIISNLAMRRGPTDWGMSPETKRACTQGPSLQDHGVTTDSEMPKISWRYLEPGLLAIAGVPVMLLLRKG